MYKGKISKRILISCAAGLFWLAVWWIASAAVSQELLLPSPYATVSRLFTLAAKAEFWQITAASLLRVFCGTAAALVTGVLAAAICCKFSVIDKLLSPVITVIKSTPVASFIILALVWLGRGILPSFISFLIVFPVVFTNVCEGIRHTPDSLLRMSAVFSLGAVLKIKRIYIPSVMPYFVSAVKTSLGLAWKAGIAAEVLAFTPLSIGRMLAESKNYLETVDLFAWTVLIIILSLGIELIFTQLVAYGERTAAGGKQK